MKRFRIKLVAHDAHYFYADTLDEVQDVCDQLDDSLLGLCEYQVYVYIETPLGHVRIK